MSVTETVGQATIDGLAYLGDLTILTGRSLHAAVIAPFQGQRLRVERAIHQAMAVGVGAVPILSLISFFIGTILALQSAYELRRFGAMEFVANAVAVSMTRELGPLMTAIVVIGRSGIVGKPMAQLLLAANATVTTCHSRTRDLAHHTLEADVLVAAVGQPHMVKADMVKPGSTVIDVGLTRTDDGLFGDVDPAAAERAGYMTPVPGGVGPMTIAMVLQNTVTAARARRARGLANPAH